jgi:glycosyltransferase involved in cell wall biosynthesis
VNTTHAPKVSIGLPVYNGERYLEGCLECLTGQTFRDVEIIISDNASTDRTREICEAYAARDPRIRYHRQASNIGAGPNYNELLRLARADYFQWAPYDDRLSPDYVERCVAALDADPAIVLAYGSTVIIDAEGKETERYADPIRIVQAEPSRRFAEYLAKVKLTTAIYGVIRIATLRATGGLGLFVSSDLVLLGELALRGPFRELPEAHFYRRMHPANYASEGTWAKRAAWFDPKNAGKLILPSWTHLFRYRDAIGRTPMSLAERLRCYAVLLRRERYEWPDLRDEALAAIRLKVFRIRGKGE